MTTQDESGWAIWFVGLPGSGKSTYAQAVYEQLLQRNIDVIYLSMDERRRVYSFEPEYTAEEREQAYRMFVQEAAELTGRGRNVIMDGTGHKLWMRHHARNLIHRFAEIYVYCPPEVAIEREKGRSTGQVMPGLYEKALERKEKGTVFEGLGEVVGVDVPFEEDTSAECIIESDRMSIEEGRDLVLEFMEGWLEDSR